MIALIVAKSKNNVIGKDGKIPWSIPGEQQQFKSLTTNNIVIMGRRTYEEIGKPLSNRFNIVISKTKNYEGDNLTTVSSLEEALKYVENKDIYIAGGYNVFKEAIPLVDKMYITEINQEIKDGTTFFPDFDINDFEKELIDENEQYKRLVYTRKKDNK